MTPTVGLYRARLGLVVAVVGSVVALVCWLPLGELLHQRGELASLSASATTIDATNAALQNQVRSLQQNTSIEAIAHQQFGLVMPGQLSYVILPEAGSSRGAPGLVAKPIPAADLVADAPSVAPSSATRETRSGGFLARFVSRLEFWR